MKRNTGWLLFAAVLSVLACQFGGQAATPVPTAAPIIITATFVPTALVATPTSAPTVAATLPPTPGCAAWFFKFRPGQDAGGCADPVVTVDAVGVDFVGGRVYRYGPTVEFPDQRGTIFVIYNNGTWETYPDTFASGDPDSDPGIVPPSGRFQPTGAIGKVWRENKAVRAALGWAYGPEKPFSGRYQNPQGDTHNIYVDHGKGLVLRLTEVDQGPRTWKVVGDY